MAKKNLYEYSLRVDTAGDFRFSNETGELQKPENCISYLHVGVLGCMGLTARGLLEKMRIPYTGVVVEGRLTMVEGEVRYAGSIECSLRVEGAPEMSAEQKARLVDLTKKHCSVSVTIANNPKITLGMD